MTIWFLLSFITSSGIKDKIKQLEERTKAMSRYIVNSNPQSNGDHEVHLYPESLCKSPKYPLPENQVDLGEFSGCHGAVAAATRRGYSRANGCYYCSNACHTS